MAEATPSGRLEFLICCFAPAKRMWPEGLIASIASGVPNHPDNLVHSVCSSSLLDRIYRIEEDLYHARLTLHAASALKPEWRQGRAVTT